MYGKADIKFKDGPKMQEAHEGTQLGGKLTKTASRHVEVLSRPNKALQTRMKLKKSGVKQNDRTDGNYRYTMLL